MIDRPVAPTPNPDLNAVLHELVTRAQAILQQNFVGAYLQGSFALGDWDADSDVDFMMVIEHEPGDDTVLELQTMHADVFALASSWAQHLEGS